MNLQLLEEYIGRYKEFLKTYPLYQEEYKWECTQYFQNNWDLTEPDIKTMYNKSLHSMISRKLWVGPGWVPKKMMMKFMEMEPEFCRSMFQDLFDESKKVEHRIDRFIFYCDQLYDQYQTKHPRSKDYGHDHNHKICSVYLAFRYPDKYTVYESKQFYKTLDLIGALDKPEVNDMDRFFKVVRTLDKFIEKDEELLAIMKEKLEDEQFYKGKSLLLAQDFYYCCSVKAFEI